MDTPSDSFWMHIQATARELARQQSIPSARHAEAIVQHIVRKEGASLPDGHTPASLAAELVRAIVEAVSRSAGHQKMS
jgi:hypothetical protein